MKHITHNGHQLMTKNKLEKAVADYLKSIDRTFLPDNNALAAFKHEILKSIISLNDTHRRCKSIEARWFETDKNDWLLSGVPFCHFMIYHVKRDL